MEKYKNSGVCKLCDVDTDLCKSHAIPDAIFKKLFRKFSGKAIKLSGDERVGYTSDSWWDYQLCAACERKLNIAYDKKAIKYLVHEECRVPYGNGVILRSIVPRVLRMFYISVLWRAVNSRHPVYAPLVCNVDSAILKDVKKYIFDGVDYPENKCMVTLYYLYDSEGVLSAGDFANFPCSPFERDGSYWFIFAGFACEIKFGFFSLSKRMKKGVIYGDQAVFVTPLDFLDIPELACNLYENVEKHKAGKSLVALS